MAYGYSPADAERLAKQGPIELMFSNAQLQQISDRAKVKQNSDQRSISTFVDDIANAKDPSDVAIALAHEWSQGGAANDLDFIARDPKDARKYVPLPGTIGQA